MVLAAFVPFGFKAFSSAMVSADLMKYKANATILLTINIAAVILCAAFAIFLFKKRTMQTWISLLALLLSVAVVVQEYLFLHNIIEAAFSFGIALPILSVVFCFMACMGIRADEKLVKSVDRFRD